MKSCGAEKQYRSQIEELCQFERCLQSLCNLHISCFYFSASLVVFLEVFRLLVLLYSVSSPTSRSAFQYAAELDTTMDPDALSGVFASLSLTKDAFFPPLDKDAPTGEVVHHEPDAEREQSQKEKYWKAGEQAECDEPDESWVQRLPLELIVYIVEMLDQDDVW